MTNSFGLAKRQLTPVISICSVIAKPALDLHLMFFVLMHGGVEG